MTNLKQLDEVMRKTTDSLGTVTVNVSKGMCISCAVKNKNIRIRGEKENLDDYEEEYRCMRSAVKTE